jgi:hypothetical protein
MALNQSILLKLKMLQKCSFHYHAIIVDKKELCNLVVLLYEIINIEAQHSPRYIQFVEN